MTIRRRARIQRHHGDGFRPARAYGRPVHPQNGQATVEWTGLALLVTIILAVAVAGAAHLGTAGLPQRLVCRIAGERCAPRPALAALTDGPPKVFHAQVPVHGGGPFATTAALAPGAALLDPAAKFLERHGKLVRKVVVATAIGVGVAATCAGAVVAANAIGGAMCGSTIVTGGYAAYRNATS